MQKLMIIPLAVLALFMVPQPTPGGDNAIEELSERIALIEKATLRDTSRPSETHAARIEKLEKKLIEDNKASEVSAKSFAALQHEVETLSRRLTDFEKQNPEKRFDTTTNEVRSLEKKLADQERELKELMTRVKKLESVVKP